MNRWNVVAVASALSATVGITSAASAQTMTAPTPVPARGERSYFAEPVAAPRNAFELTVGTGYTQGFGSLRQGVGMTNVVTPGLAVDVGAGYRFSPRWGVTATAQFQELTAERADMARGMTGGIASTLHLAPHLRSDPWLQLGSGYRILWERDTIGGGDLTTHGFQLLKLTGGFDVRVTEDIGVSPVIGADLNLFLWQDGATNIAIGDPRPNTFVFAGAQGRFDFAGTRESEAGWRSARVARR